MLFSALASLFESLLLKGTEGTGDRMVGTVTVVELLGRVAHLACLSLCEPGFAYQCVMHIIREFSVRIDGKKDRALRLE